MNAQLPLSNPNEIVRPDDPSVVQSVSHLAAGISADAQTLVSQHTDLLKAELKESGEQATWSAVLIVGGTAGVVIGALFLLIGLVGLTAWMFPTLPAWAAWVSWGGGLMLLALTSVFLGARIITRLNLIPHRTLRSLRESLSCLLERLK